MFKRQVPPTAGLPLQWKDFSGSKESFARGLADFLQVDSLQLESSGTAALVVAFAALKRLDKRRTVILSGYTCPLVAIAAAQAGLKILVCDTKKDSFEFDTQQLEQLRGPDVLCVVVTHLAGLAADLAPVRQAAAGAYIIEDAAQCLGAKSGGRMLGTAGDIGIFSLACGKGLSLYDGGFLYAADPAVREAITQASATIVPQQPWLNWLRILQMIGYWFFYRPNFLELVYGRELRYHVRRKDFIAAVGDYFEFVVPLYRFNDWRLSVGANALKRLSDFVTTNRLRGLARREQLKKRLGIERLGIEVLGETTGCEGSWPFLMLLFTDEKERDLVLDKLWTAGLGVTRLFVHSLSDYEYLRPIVPKQELPNASDFAARMLTITNSHWLEDQEFERIAEIISGCLPPGLDVKRSLLRETSK
ncbi:MAG: DegT/DnrJ/EryC1/StrS family aminotransferase [Candidatus Obscuribacterales bacterium]|jgi:perosamine synthetase|nr:DegT/DnrJ/EryC1/StrS family aminotransferase [Candidatus Obscuribacterales bacterium]